MYTDDFGNRMKAYEAIETSRVLNKLFPIYARIDGRSFSKFTKGFDKPYDTRLMGAMNFATEALVANTHAKIGYVQSDEISLIWEYPEENTEPLFGGKVHKLNSVLASLASSAFMVGLQNKMFEKAWPFLVKLPHFDCRIINLPNRSEAANMLLWRAMDCRKNAVSMAAQSRFSHKELHGKDQNGMLEMLISKGVNFESTYPWAFKDGRFFQRKTVTRELTYEELECIPEKHRPSDPVTRTEVSSINMPRFNLVKNRVDVIFEGAEPVT